MIAVIETHAPIDVLVIMLGTNDFKDQFSNSSFNSARGTLTLIQMVKGHYALIERGPEVLIVTPPALSAEAEPAIWGDGARKCVGHANYLGQIADRTRCFHFDSNSVVRAGIDGVHLDEPSHLVLGRALAEKVAAILEMPVAR